MAKTGLMKKYIRLANGDFQKAWKLQKAAKKKTTKKKVVRKKTVRKKAVKKRVIKKRATPKKTVKKRVVKKVVSTKKRKAAPVARKKTANAPKRRRTKRGGNVQKILMDGAGAAVGAVVAGVAANALPLPDPRLKAAMPIVAGVILANMKIGRSAMAKMACVGMISAGTLALVKQTMPGVPLLAGEEVAQIDYIPESQEEAALLGESELFDGESELYDDDVVDVDLSSDEENNDLFLSPADM